MKKTQRISGLVGGKTQETFWPRLEKALVAGLIAGGLGVLSGVGYMCYKVTPKDALNAPAVKSAAVAPLEIER